MAHSLNPEIVPAAAFAFDSTADLERGLRREAPFYSRWDNPTVQAVEARLSGLVGAEATLLFGSGMAAVSSALLAALADRPRLLCQAQVYGATHELASTLLRRWGVDVTFFEIDGWQAAFEAARKGPPVGAVWLETPTNPTLRVIDLAGAAKAARALGALSLVDNTFASPLNQRPLELGCDVEVHSATKYLGGHHDLLAGSVSGSKVFIEKVWKHRKLLGGCLDPFPAYLLHRGLLTLDVRVARQNQTSLELARRLEGHPRVARVLHPGLPSHPDHALAARQMRGFGGMLSFVVRGGDEAAVRVVDALETVSLATSLGGTESLCCMPSNTSHANLSAAERARLGIDAGMVRLSVGLEPTDALLADLERALARAS